MTGRRHALRLLLGGLGALASCRTAPRGSSIGDSPGEPGAPAEAAAWRRLFLEDFRRTSSRTYSEEGIPVFLLGVDQAPAGGRTPDARAVPAESRRLAADLRRGASVLAEARLATSADDVGKLVEVLAERDFGSLRRVPRS